MKDHDAMLVQATLDGDQAAFGSLVDQYEKKLYNASYRITGSREDAMDATQAAFVKAYENLHTFDFAHRFFSWIYRIALNEALTVVRRRRRVTDVDSQLPDSAAGPEQTTSGKETGQIIQEVLTNLNPDHRVVVVLRHFEGLSYFEIGEVLGIPSKTVKSRLFSARQELRTALLDRGVSR
jgi:RNA polymerase sigma-70 factor (ECF subfamily)